MQEKKKNKAFMMVKHKVKGKNKRSFREKQVRLPLSSIYDYETKVLLCILDSIVFCLLPMLFAFLRA